MSTLTKYLKLFKWNTKTDGSEKFDIDKSMNDNWDKIDEDAEQANTRLTTVEKKAETLEANTEMTDTTEISEEITVENCAGVCGKLDVKSGKSEQKTSVQGKNLCPPLIAGKGLNITNGNETSSEISAISDFIPINLSQNPSYYYKHSFTDWSLCIFSYNENKEYLGRTGNNVRATFELTKNSLITASSGKEGEISYVRIMLSKGGSSTEEIKTALSTAEIQLEIGDTSTGYEPFIPNRPSPNYSSPIRNCGENGNINFKVQNRNIADVNLLYNQMRKVTTNVREETIDNKNCLVFFSSYFRGDTSNPFKGLQGIYKKNARYRVRFSGRVNDTSLTSGNSLYIEFFDEKGTKIHRLEKKANGANWITFDTITPENTSLDYLGFGYGTATWWCIDKDSFIIEEYTGKETDYIEHKEQIKSFPLEKGQVLHKDDYLAEDGIHQAKKTYAFDGTEDFLLYSYVFNNIKAFRTELLDLKELLNNENIISSHFKKVDNTIFNNDQREYGMIMNMTPHFIYFSQPSLDIDTVQKFKDWLAQKKEAGTPVIVEYELAEEQIIPYTKAQEQAYYELQHLLLYEGYTNITCIDEIKPDIQLTYYINNELNKTYAKRCDEIEKRVRTLELAGGN